jgi:hypothetical protein
MSKLSFNPHICAVFWAYKWCKKFPAWEAAALPLGNTRNDEKIISLFWKNYFYLLTLTERYFSNLNNQKILYL